MQFPLELLLGSAENRSPIPIATSSLVAQTADYRALLAQMRGDG